MRKIKFTVLVAISLLVSAFGAFLLPIVSQAKEKEKEDFFSLLEQEGGYWVPVSSALEKIVFVHYRKDLAKSPGEKEQKAITVQCYGFLAANTKWRNLPIEYVVHPDVEAVVPGAVFGAAETWDAAISKELFSNTYKIDNTATWDSNVPDGRNEMVFGNYPKDGVIAVTVIWGYFSGPSYLRRIIEFDVLFDTGYSWGDATQNPAVMDLQNIATHEIGHGVGLADRYVTACREVTMYGYSGYGEIKKRTLEAADITGLRSLYGF